MAATIPPFNGDPPLRKFLDGTFRLNPAFGLVEHKALSPDQRVALKGVAEAPDHFGLLVSADIPELGVLAVNRDSALLFSRLRQPGFLPAGTEDPNQIAGLVLDGILEIAWDGRYLTGPAAYPCLFAGPPREPEPADKTAILSLAALKTVQALPLAELKAISSWLYHYHCLPLTPAWARQLASPERINTVLGLQPGGPAQLLLDDHFAAYEIPGWRAWRNLTRELTIGDDEPTFKLYISPHPNALAEAFPIIVQCLVAANVASFKLGSDAFGLLRPDKLIAYFAGYDALEALATSLARALAGCAAHGVPFTADLSGDGLLSWGMDPPLSEQIPGWRGVESWRLWITNRLARAILRARVLGDGGLEPWHYALLRLRLEGVQIQTWLPGAALWANGPEVQ